MASNGRGTMAPGQTISVNKYTVQVERYLSQGGFAHVYLVRTATPVYNTTHHVLKRIAVANDAMLTEVKKEVDIMRILKGHPNIVHLIDAAWHRMSNGTYEVFILMEFCPGGGIIDMMNRRLRERLTEAEILTIFVDVCEGVAAMHNLRPALLHRDLKVENILQASATSYKLCDFGSATSVASKPPSTTQEIRALEADLNKHTTLQYRAPEMVDPYLRRPVDEKSDVWALGVLLYKLCYYTTPFEEHGPLAILNVQYKIPPYPIYSSQMNSLIASMLREHGTQRPSIFETLEVVHRIRGTKSRFSYSIPEKQPLSPRTVTSSNNFSALDDLVAFNSQPTFATKNAGTQARDKVLEAIAPMRRGRPNRDLSPSPSPKDKNQDSWMNGHFSTDIGVNDQEWKTPPKDNVNRGHKLGVTSSDAWKVNNPVFLNDGLGTRSDIKSNLGFDNDFSGKGYPSFSSAPGAPKSISNPVQIPAHSSQTPTSPALSSDLSRLGAPRSLKSKDAFDGLGLSEKRPAPTLGEVRKARTGLALPDYSFYPRRLSPQPQPAPSPLPSSHPLVSTSQNMLQNLTIEERFPSVEELDRRIFGGSNASPLPSPRPESKTPYFGEVASRESSLGRSATLSHTSRGIKGGSQLTVETSKLVVPSDGHGAHRSQNVTGTAMRDSTIAPTKRQENNTAATWQVTGDTTNSQITGRSRSPRPALTRKHRSSIIVQRSSTTFDTVADSGPPKETPMQSLTTSHNWLTGDDEGHSSDLISRIGKDSTSIQSVENDGAPVLRESPSKRASFFSKSPHLIADALEGDVDEGGLFPPPALPPRPSSGVSHTKQASSFANARKPPPLVDISPSATGKAAVGGGLTDDWSPVATDITTSPTEKNLRRVSLSSDSEEDEGPEDVNGYGSLTGKNRTQVQQRESKVNPVGKAKRRQSSVHDLVDLWGGSSVLNKEKERSSKDDIDPAEQKRRSVILPSSTTAYVGPVVGSPSPQPMSTYATLQNSSVGSPSRGSDKRVVAPPLQKSTSSTTSGQTRSRPQSMFVFPSSKPIAEGTGPPSPGLAVPPEGLRTISASRRTSISDMVHRYEEIGVGTKLSSSSGYTGFAPSILTKSAGLKITTTEDPVPIGPGNSSSRYNTNSPIKVLGSDPSVSEHRPSRGGSRRTSPVGIQDRTSPKRTEFANKKSITADSIRYDSSNTKVNSEDNIVSGADPRSSSPERPFVGVSKLIDQWQKKVEESNSGGRNSGGSVVKRYGIVNGSPR